MGLQSDHMNHSALLNAYYEYEADLLRFLSHRLKCGFAAKDLVQEVYLRLLKIKNPTGIENRKAYLFRIASNLATDHIRVEARRAELLRECRDVLIRSENKVTPEREALARWELKLYQKAVQELPPLSRKIFYLNRFAGKPQRAIAKEVGVSVTTVEKHIRRVLDHLAATRDRLETQRKSKSGV
ncbi:RNA polymerase sigma factor [Nitrospina watsonii]|nr:RNA polymerase sigma factor [Nitrospina watsonii]